MGFLKEYSVWIQGAIVSAIILAITLLISALIFKVTPKKDRKSIKYIYSFGSGFVLITAILGQFAEGREVTIEYLENSSIPESLHPLISLSIIIAGVTIGALVALLVTYTYKKITVGLNGNSHSHSHHIDNEYEVLTHNHSKLPGIWMIASHRLPAGLAIGGLLYNADKGIGEFSTMGLIAFIIHIVPELLIIYFGLLDSGKTKWQALKFGIIAKIIIIIGVFIGIAFARVSQISALFWLQPTIFILVGTIIVWAVIMELAPEFTHNSVKGKTVSMMSIIFIVGVASSLFIQFIHVH